MSETEPTAPDASVDATVADRTPAPEATDDLMHETHGMAGEGGHGDDHHDAHTGERLGPIDWPLWGAAVLGVGVAVFIALLMALVVGMI